LPKTKNSFRKKVKRKFGRLHVGSRKRSNLNQFYWALDVPQATQNSFFKDKCLLICTLYGLFQNQFFSSNKCDNTFTYLQNVNSVFTKKQTHARNILTRELSKLFEVTKLQTIGPYQLQVTCKILSETYKCQFFIFSNTTTKHKLHFMYPENYDDSLKPIYLYQNFDNPHHLIFIKNINSYFKANYLVCFECKKSFKTHTYKHLCKKRPSCFACRRFFQNDSTYIHEKLKNNFCDKLVSSEPTLLCEICNCTLYSKHCLKGHRTFCNGIKGHFGFKCLKGCNRFIYASKNQTSSSIKENHECGTDVKCKFCFKTREPNHLCKLKPTRILNYHSRLAFFNLEFLDLEEPIPIFALFYVEEDIRGTFKKHLIADEILSLNILPESFNYQYFLPNQGQNFNNATKRKAKVTQDFVEAIASLKYSENFNFNKQLALFFLSSPNTTFICQDKEGSTMVRITYRLSCRRLCKLQ